MKQVRFGMVGLGDMGRKHIQSILEQVPEATVSAIATQNAEHIRQVRAISGMETVHVFETPAQMYASGLIDAVLIATPHRLHVPQSLEAFSAGMHVLLEKPTGVYTEEVRRMNAAADASGKAFGVMFNVRTHPCFRKMREIVSSGEMGEIRRVNVIITDWFRAQSYFDSGAWRATWKRDGGGVLLNQAPHNLDLLQWICGMPERVHAFCGFGRWHDIEVEDDVTAWMQYKNGATGTFITCTGECPGTNRFEISLDGGQLLYENGRLLRSDLSMSAGQFIREYPGGYGKPDVTVTDITPKEDYPKHAGVIRAFARHILQDGSQCPEPMIADGREGLCSLTLSNAMLLSQWTGRTIELPLCASDEAEFAARLEALSRKSPEKTARKIVMDLSKSF